LDPVASFTPPVESRHRALEYPLEMLARKADNFLNSTFCNLPGVQKIEHTATRDGFGLLEMTAADAQGRGISDGDLVRVFNARGEIRLRARLNGKVQPGVVAAGLNWAKLAAEGRNINVLTSERLADLAGGPTFYSTLVEVERSAP
jgi:anaerobic selenocysteine-containing dehydrogenase